MKKRTPNREILLARRIADVCDWFSPRLQNDDPKMRELCIEAWVDYFAER